MDADNSHARQQSPANGGTIEPADRAAVAKDRAQQPVITHGERYELRDPVAEVTYRSKTFQEMIAKAQWLGSDRFVAVADDGKRTPVQKIDGDWQRGSQRPATSVRTLESVQMRDEVPDGTRTIPLPATKAPAISTQPAQLDLADAKASAKLDAQAERAALVARLEAALMERYIVKRAPVSVGDVTIGRTEYRFRGDTTRVAFTESALRLATDQNSPSVARSMVDVAETRGWKALRVSGHEEFRRMVWFEATLRGVKAIGYEPMPSDLAWLRSERETRLVNRIEPTREASSGAATEPTEKASGRSGGGRKTVLAAIEALLIARKVPEKQRVAVMAAAAEKLAQRIRDGQMPKVKIYDKAAPSQRTLVVTTPEMQLSRDRTTPAPVR